MWYNIVHKALESFSKHKTFDENKTTRFDSSPLPYLGELGVGKNRFQILIKRLIMNIYKIAYHLMNKHNLKGWHFKLHDPITDDNGSHVVGYCSSTLKVISLDKVVAEEVSFMDVRSIILHEIAHAIVDMFDNKHDHDTPYWKHVVKSIGSHHCEASVTKPLKRSNVKRDIDNIHVLDYMKYDSNVDEICFMLNKRFGLGTKYWYDEYLKISSKINETNQ